MSEYDYKQMLVMRTDLKMRRGKEIAQASHASVKVTLENLDHPYVVGWLKGRFAKIAVGIDSEDELKSLVDEATKLNIPATLIVDAGFTEFNGIPTVTCAAIGPGPVEVINKLTGHLKLR